MPSLSIENFQYGFEQTPVCAHDDDHFPIHERLFRGPNTWPQTDTMPGFRPLIEDLNQTYHKLTHELGELIVESLGENPQEFKRYFDFDDPDLAASLNHNFSLDVFRDEAQQQVRESYATFDSTMEGDLIPFGKAELPSTGIAGYNAGRDRGANACVNRMGTFPQVTRRWWVKEFEALSEKQRAEVEAETSAAYKLAAERGKRYAAEKTGSDSNM